MSFFCHHIFAIKWDILKFVSLQFKLWSVILSVWSSIRLCCSYFTVRTPWPAYRGAKASLVMMRRGSFRSVLDVKYIQEYLQKGRARKMLHPHDMLTVVMAVLYLMRCEPSAALHCSRVTLLYCSPLNTLLLLLLVTLLAMTARYLSWLGGSGSEHLASTGTTRRRRRRRSASTSQAS